MHLRRPLLQIRHTKQPIRQHRHEHIKQYKRKYDAEIPPALVERNAHRRQELVAVGQTAVLARGARGRVLYHAAGGRGVGLEVGPACLAGGRVEDGDFARGADDGAAGEHGGYDAADPVREGPKER
jgi:hypothetical protein